MKRAVIISILCVLFAAHAESYSPTRPIAQKTIEAEEYAVYSVVIQTIYGSERSNRVIIVDTAEGMSKELPEGETGEGFKPKGDGWENVPFKDFLARNRQPLKWDRSVKLSVDYILINRDELNNIFRTGGWQNFFSKYPGSTGYISFSRVGFNADLTQALLFVERHCDGLCGEGKYVLMSKRDGVWYVEKTQLIWVS